jgi:ankyrin repeat protein
MIDDRLTDAARRGDTPVVLALIDEGEQDHRAEALYLALLWAASLNRTETMRALIAAGTDVNAAHYRGHRILAAAAKKGQRRCRASASRNGSLVGRNDCLCSPPSNKRFERLAGSDLYS